jgi:sarcosine oxidase subunit beta
MEGLARFQQNQPTTGGDMAMPQTADAVIMGGGVMGCSILYNVAKRGMPRCLLLEQDVLGSGSTGRSQAICRMHYSNPVTASLAWESLKIFTH